MRAGNVLVAVVTVLLLAACSGKKEQVASERTFSKLDSAIGLLHYSDTDKCRDEAGCGPEFSLVNVDFNRYTAVYGKLDPNHHYRLVYVEGKPARIKKEDAQYLGAMSGGAMKMKRYRLLSKLPYRPFLPEQAAKFTKGKYGCELLWDKTYSWQVTETRTRLIVRMSDTFAQTESKPYVELHFDGNTGHLLEEILETGGRNPCRL